MVTNNSWNSEDPAQVAKGGTGVASNTAYAVLCGGTTATNPIQSIAGVGTSGQVLTSNGAAALPTFQDSGAAGFFIQQQRTQTSANFTTTTIIPQDNTIPQISEGIEVATVSITPTSGSSILCFEFNFSVDNQASSASFGSAALFVDATVDALAAWTLLAQGIRQTTNSGRYFFSAGSTSARTYSFRYGPSTAQTLILNPQVFGGVQVGSISVTEYSS